MTIVKETTQKGQHIIRAYECAKYDSIHKAYGRPSSKKVEAFYEIKKEMEDAGGYGMRITGAGSDYFSCAYKLKEDDGTYIIYHTHANVFKVKVA